MNTIIPLKKYKKVLLIDDDDVDIFISNKIIRSTLLTDEVISKSSAEEGLNYLKELSSSPEELPEIIFLDLGMPVMDGFDFLVEFNKLGETVRKRCKIVVLTNSFDLSPAEAKKAKKAKNNFMIQTMLCKPLTAKALEEI